jgi:hypothetical protein
MHVVPGAGRQMNSHLVNILMYLQANPCTTIPPTAQTKINPLKSELNAICLLLALLGAHHILHVSRVRVNVHAEIQNPTLQVW